MLTAREFAKRHGVKYQTLMRWLQGSLIPGAIKRLLPTGASYYEIPPDAPRPILRRGPKPQPLMEFDIEKVRKLMKNLENSLSTADKATLKAQLAAHYYNLAIEADAYLNAIDENSWLARLEIEHEHLLATLDYFAALPATLAAEKEIKLLLALVRFWDMSGRYTLAEPRLTYALDRQPIGDSVLKATALARLGLISYRQGRYESAKQYLAKALAMGRTLNNPEVLALSLNVLGRVQKSECAYTNAKASFAEALSIAEAAGLLKRVGWAYRGMGEVAEGESDYRAAWGFHHQALVIAEEIGNVREIAAQRDSLGMLLIQSRDFDQAAIMLQHALALRMGGGNKNGVAQTYFRLGLLEEARGDSDAAEVWMGKSERLYHEIGNPAKGAEVREALGRVAGVRG